jgi:serine/threonine protein kinase
MRWLSDATLDHLRQVVDWPDLTGSKYEVLEKIGQGGMASVYLARDRDLDRQVAVKVSHLRVADPAVGDRMLTEARIIARLEHPGIVPVHDVGRLPDGRLYYTMKLVRGSRLDEYSRQPASLSQRLLLFEKVCEAVAFAHTHGVIHRDLKPENIMVGAFGEVLVMDWGVARWGGDDSKPLPSTAGRRQSIEASPTAPAGTADGTVVGTPGYMSPEQARGEVEGIDQRTDVYALGALLHFLLTGSAPSADSPRDLTNPQSPAIPPVLAAICRRALAADPDHRYPGVGDLSDEVLRYLGGLRVQAYPEGILGATIRLASRYRSALWLIAAYLAMRLLLLFFTGG